MPFLELSLIIPLERQPGVEDALEQLQALSVTLRDANAETPDEEAIFEPGVGELPLWPTITLSALFDEHADAPGITTALRELLPWLQPDQLTFDHVADQDWERVWMDQFKPMPFGRRLWIYPWNIEPPAGDEQGNGRSNASGDRDTSTSIGRSNASCDRDTSMSIGRSIASCDRDTRTSMCIGRSNASGDGDTRTSMCIVRLDPGLAFGSGTHPTTALCLEWLDGLDLTGKMVTDFGCGSGILAIAALKLGAARALGVDNDPQALIASADNAQRNGVADRLSLFLPQDFPIAAAPSASAPCPAAPAAVPPASASANLAPPDISGPVCAASAHPGAVPADVFVANILAGPLGELAPTFAAATKPGAPFAISGILVGQQHELMQRYAEWFDELRADVREDWVRISGRRR